MAAITREIAKASIASADHTGEGGDDERRADQGRVEAAVGQLSGRRAILDADQDGDPGLFEAAHGLWTGSSTLGSRRASAAPQAARFARGTRVTTRCAAAR